MIHVVASIDVAADLHCDSNQSSRAKNGKNTDVRINALISRCRFETALKI